MKIFNLALRSCIGLFAVCFTLPAYSQAAGNAEAFNRALTQAQAAATNYYLHGEPEQALQQFQALAKNADWQSLLQLGNVVWKLEPAQSFQWHMQAYEGSGRRDNAALLELAYDYTRQDDCPRAIEAWRKLDAAGMLKGYTSMLAGYCYFKLGQDDQALQMFNRAVLQQQQFEDSLIDLWTPDALAEYARSLSTFKAESNPANLQAVLDNAIKLSSGKERGTALLAITDASKASPKNLGSVPGQLNCLRPAFEAEAAKPAETVPRTTPLQQQREAINRADAAIKTAWQQRLENCKLLTNGNSLPENSTLAKLLVTYALNNKLASAAELLAMHGSTLNERARSQAGDHDALRVLASLQEAAQHPDLKNSDELGWSRYADPEFAVSRINKIFQSGNTLSPEDLALLDKAHREFPRQQRILMWWLMTTHPSAEAARQGWREVILLEFHRPTLRRDPIHFWIRAMILYSALNEYRKILGK
jgi:tetratricopeptide (TPR) repeat protein